MANEHYVVMTVECSVCKIKQKIHVETRSGSAQIANQTLRCIQCTNYFHAPVPGKILRGPFPA
jgi:hypothetical protein